MHEADSSYQCHFSRLRLPICRQAIDVCSGWQIVRTKMYRMLPLHLYAIHKYANCLAGHVIHHKPYMGRCRQCVVNGRLRIERVWVIGMQRKNFGNFFEFRRCRYVIGYKGDRTELQALYYWLIMII